MLKITIDVSTLINGINSGSSKYTYYILKNLDIDPNIKLTLFSYCPIKTHKNFISFLESNFKQPKKIIIPLPSKITNDVLLIWQKLNYPFIDCLIRNTDIFHSFGVYHPPLRNIKGIATIHDLNFLDYPSWTSKSNYKLHKEKLKRVENSCKYLVVESNSTKNEILKKTKYKGIIEVIKPGVDSNIFKPYSDKNKKEIKNQFGINKDFFLSFYELSPRKNSLRIIKAFLKFNELYKNKFQLVILGKNQKLDNKYKNLIFLKNIKEKELAKLYSSAEALLYPSLYEGFGIPIIEAMSSNTPVITSKNAGGIEEAANDSAIKINPKSTNEIINSMKTIIVSSKQKNHYVESGNKHSQKFSWQKSTQKLIQFYKKIK